MLVIVVGLIGTFLSLSDVLGTPLGLLGKLLFPLVAAFGVILHRTGRKLFIVLREENRLHDQRAYVLYLRPFQDDIETESVGIGLLGTITPEEQLVSALNTIGPVVAVGDPQDKLPRLGAQRVYVRDGDWRTRVQAMMNEARLIVIRVGPGESILWELQHAIATKLCKQVVLMIPDDELRYEAFRSDAQRILPVPLPKLGGWRIHGSLRGMICFDTGWVPHVLDLRSFIVSLFRFSLHRSLEIKIRMASQPLCDALGVRWNPPSITVLGVLVVLGIILSAAVVVSAASIAIVALAGQMFGRL